MANTKGSAIRQRVIDRSLQSVRGYSIAEMMEKCNRELEARMFLPVSSMNTIREDINEICNSYHVVVEMIRSGRNKRYRYKDGNFSIYTAPLSERDMTNLQELLSSLSVFEGRPQLEWMQDASVRIQSTLACSQSNRMPVVGFDDNPDLKGREYFQPLFNAITQNHAIELTYHSFRKGKDIDYVLHPYYLKQYNNRWFLFGCVEGYETLTNFALDRIVSLKNATISYKPNTKFDFSTYFDDIVGVSKPKDGIAEPVRLWVSQSLIPYIITKPIHSSQQIISEDNEGTILQLNLIPNFELEQLLLSYGEGLKVLYPETLRKKMQRKIEKSAENYDRCSSAEPIDTNFAPSFELNGTMEV